LKNICLDLWGGWQEEERGDWGQLYFKKDFAYINYFPLYLPHPYFKNKKKNTQYHGAIWE
jgi:hypothetical protein